MAGGGLLGARPEELIFTDDIKLAKIWPQAIFVNKRRQPSRAPLNGIPNSDSYEQFRRSRQRPREKDMSQLPDSRREYLHHR